MNSLPFFASGFFIGRSFDFGYLASSAIGMVFLAQGREGLHPHSGSSEAVTPLSIFYSLTLFSLVVAGTKCSSLAAITSVIVFHIFKTVLPPLHSQGRQSHKNLLKDCLCLTLSLELLRKLSLIPMIPPCYYGGSILYLWS